MGINVVTNQNVKINYNICSIGDRMLAYIIDMFVITGISLVIFFFATLTITSFKSDNLYIFSIIIIPVFFYHLICEVTMNGQSIGKRSRNIKVIKADGREATFSNYFLRFLLRPIDSFYLLGLAFIFFFEKSTTFRRFSCRNGYC